eukprot:Skav225835  [mRNA]  locus=scaffold345:66586:69251:+ [translate_table: standard]
MARASKQRSQKVLQLLFVLCVAVWELQPNFAGICSYRRQLKTSRWAVCAQVKEPPAEGDRVIVDGDDGPIVVAKIDGKYYAVDGKCPHLGLPMKQGKIENGPEGPTLTCNFHNSEFNMKSGVCTKRTAQTRARSCSTNFTTQGDRDVVSFSQTWNWACLS